jgi:predicted acylesterase/phospholipase RssA
MRFTSSIGLSLSGGGFRATLHHLGLIRYLRDAGVLAHVKDIAAVSGGSILAAHLVLNWDR